MADHHEAGRYGPHALPSRVTVVMPTLLRDQMIDRALSALAEQDYGGVWELIVSVNVPGPDLDDFAHRWRQSFASIRAVDSSTVVGVSHARNVGARAGTGDFIVFCDDDDIADPGWLSAMVAKAAEADIVGGRVDDLSLNPPHVRGRYRPKPQDRLPVALGFLPYAIGCNFGVRRDVFETLDGFREDFVGADEEVELCWRAQLEHGFRVAYAADAVIKYRYRAELASSLRQIYRYGRNEPRLYREYRHRSAQLRRARGAGRFWVSRVRHLPDLARGDEARQAWLGYVAYRAGRLAGSVRHRVLFP